MGFLILPKSTYDAAVEEIIPVQLRLAHSTSPAFLLCISVNSFRFFRLLCVSLSTLQAMRNVSQSLFIFFN